MILAANAEVDTEEQQEFINKPFAPAPTEYEVFHNFLTFMRHHVKCFFHVKCYFIIERF